MTVKRCAGAWAAPATPARARARAPARAPATAAHHVRRGPAARVAKALPGSSGSQVLGRGARPRP
eukprot:14187493-Alexandrium_andersonii.AAC.1